MEIKLYNPNFSASESKIKEMLANADLEGHGYKKKIKIFANERCLYWRSGHCLYSSGVVVSFTAFNWK